MGDNLGFKSFRLYRKDFYGLDNKYHLKELIQDRMKKYDMDINRQIEYKWIKNGCLEIKQYNIKTGDVKVK